MAGYTKSPLQRTTGAAASALEQSACVCPMTNGELPVSMMASSTIRHSPDRLPEESICLGADSPPEKASDDREPLGNFAPVELGNLAGSLVAHGPAVAAAYF